MRGFVYIMVNPAMPGLLKLGGTARTTDERARELSTTSGVPTPFAVAFDQPVSDWSAAEREIHESLAERRVTRQREFFCTDLKSAIALVKSIAERYPPHWESAATDAEDATEGQVSWIGCPDSEESILLGDRRWTVHAHARWRLVDAVENGLNEPEAVAAVRGLSPAQRDFSIPVDAELQVVDATRDEMLEDVQRIQGEIERCQLRRAQASDMLSQLVRERDRLLEAMFARDITPPHGCWYYEGSVYMVHDRAATADESIVYVMHFAERRAMREAERARQRAQKFAQLAEETAMLRKRRTGGP